MGGGGGVIYKTDEYTFLYQSRESDTVTGDDTSPGPKICSA